VDEPATTHNRRATGSQIGDSSANLLVVSRLSPRSDSGDRGFSKLFAATCIATLVAAAIHVGGGSAYGARPEAPPSSQPPAAASERDASATANLSSDRIAPKPLRIVHAGFNEEAADSIARLVAGGLWTLVPGMLLLGLGLNLTPCVYPLMSITVAYFGSQAGNSRGRKVWLALSYTMGIAVTFSIVGASAALSGGMFGAALSKPPVLIALATMMVALALSSFGVYQIKIPDTLSMRLGGSGKGTLGALFMGMTMGLVAAPCVGPVVIGLLVYVGTQGDVLLGLGLFFLLALGLGIPYVVLAVAAGSIAALPRSGAWLEWVEHFFGCVLLAMAIYFLNPILPDAVERVVMPAFLGLAIAYLAFFDPAGREFRGFVFGRRALGTVALAAIGFVSLPAAETHQELHFEPYSNATFEAARQSGSPFLVEFHAEWCMPCKEMEERTFTDPTVMKAGAGFSFLSVDMTTTDGETEEVLERFDVLGAPTTIFYGPDGNESTRRVGFIGPVDFSKLLDQTRHAPASDGAATRRSD